MSLIEPLTLQRLIDGELEASAMQNLLRDANGNPDMWKEIATAFVEDRVWQNSFVNGSQSTEEDPLIGIPISGSLENVAREGASNHNNQWKWLFSMAAAVLVATGIGFMIGNQQTDNRIPDVGIANVAPADVPATGNKFTTVSHEPDYRMQLDNDLNREIPLYNAYRAKELGLSLEPASIPESLQKFARKSGYGLDENVRYISGQMDNGQRFVVPVRRIQFIPGQ